MPSADELAAEETAEEAEALVAEGDTDAALDSCSRRVATDPANDAARFDYVKLLLEPAASTRRARRSSRWPPRPRSMRALDALGHWLDALRSSAGARAARDDARRRRSPPTSATSTPASSWRSATSPRGRFTEAMDELLEILMRDKAWNDELARKTYVAILELMSKPAAEGRAAAEPRATLEVAGKAARRRRPTR